MILFLFFREPVDVFFQPGIHSFCYQVCQLFETQCWKFWLAAATARVFAIMVATVLLKQITPQLTHQAVHIGITVPHCFDSLDPVADGV